MCSRPPALVLCLLEKFWHVDVSAGPEQLRGSGTELLWVRLPIGHTFTAALTDDAQLDGGFGQSRA